MTDKKRVLGVILLFGLEDLFVVYYQQDLLEQLTKRIRFRSALSTMNMHMRNIEIKVLSLVLRVVIIRSF